MVTKHHALIFASTCMLAACSPYGTAPEQREATQQRLTRPNSTRPVVEAAASPPFHLQLSASKAGTPASGDEQSLRNSYAKCLDDSAGATWRMQKCIEEEWTYQDARLNAAYKNLKSKLSNEQNVRVRDEQRKWLHDRDHGEECRWDAKKDGQAQRIAANDCMLKKVAVRASELETAAAEVARP
jgi:uncharacterized protein YecT (DUF1311 family)